jgi:hypothetical protein
VEANAVSTIQQPGKCIDPVDQTQIEASPGTSGRWANFFYGIGLIPPEIEVPTVGPLRKWVLEAQLAERRRGQVFWLIIGFLAIVAGSFTAAYGFEVAGLGIGGSGVIALVTVFWIYKGK